MRIVIIALLLTLGIGNLNAQIKEYKTYAEFEKAIIKSSNMDTTSVVNFWATWCIPCVKELPYFEALNTKYKQDKVKVILVSLDFTNEQVASFIEKKKIKSEVVILSDSKTNDWIDKVDTNWSGAIPITLFIKGKEKNFYEKDYHNLEELETDLLKIKNK